MNLNKYNITINQYVALNIATLDHESTAYDLLIAPAFRIFTILIQDLAVTKNNQEIFRLKREVYNGITRKQSPLSILSSGSSSEQNSYNTSTKEQNDKDKKPATSDTNKNINSKYITTNYDPNTLCKTSSLTQESSKSSYFTE
ncbi:hypothetical protein F8M41_009498 [Gigaspora margarita]|uniref:Uncharacterized protein n=1 Tax=Gigaspora margarita TaxID=4874 RepID=A0A8H3X2A5_GIGMA|nr:hypothetical protein F8M41_009498 [Gigaspora margarita]